MPFLGRRPATDDKHLVKYPLRLVMPRTIDSVESVLPIASSYRRYYHQHRGSCGGHSWSWALSILNRKRYDPEWLYDQAQLVDEWDDTPPEEGTSLRAVGDVLKAQGHKRFYAGLSKGPTLKEGIETFRWAQNVDEIRTSIAQRIPVVLGIEWFRVFDQPQKRGLDWWLPDPTGSIDGGHAICCYGASDRRQAVKLVNSWGPDYPLVWVSYRNLEKLLDGFEYPGEAAVITDRL